MRLVHALGLGVALALFAVACDEGAPQDPLRPGAGAGTRVDQVAEHPSEPARQAPSTPHAGTTPGAAPAPPANVTFAEQAAAGQKLYQANCARCHGQSGLAESEIKAFATAGDFAEYIITNMPPGGAGRMSDEEYFSIVAFELDDNGLAQERAVDAQAAEKITLR